MCGILGYIKCGSTLEISKGLEVINHRGPDFRDFKWFEEHSVGLGHARL